MVSFRYRDFRPLPWFYAVDDELAEMMLAWHRAAPGARRRLLKELDAQ